MNINDLIKPSLLSIPAYIPGDSAESAYRPGVTEILKLASNENQLGTSPKALEAMQSEILRASIYPDAFTDTLRKKIGSKFNFGDDDPERHVSVSVGSSGSISLINEVFVMPGDEVLFCDPTFGVCPSAAKRFGGVPIGLPLTAEQGYDLSALKGAITPKTKIIYICNPNNPTGTMLDPDELRAFIHCMPEHIICIIDEAYIEFSGDTKRNSMVSEIAEGVNLIVLRTFSKLYGLAGARIGFALTNKEIQQILQKCTSVFVCSSESLAGASAALDDDDFVAKTVASVSAGRDYLTKEFTRLGGMVYNSYANFIYVDIGFNTAAFAEACKYRGLIIRGNYEFSRITVGTEYQNRRVVQIVEEVIASGEVPRTR